MFERAKNCPNNWFLHPSQDGAFTYPTKFACSNIISQNVTCQGA